MKGSAHPAGDTVRDQPPGLPAAVAVAAVRAPQSDGVMANQAGGAVARLEDLTPGAYVRGVAGPLVDATLGEDVFDRYPLLIARMDMLSRSDDLKAAIEATSYDLVVVDEAHRMPAHYYGSELKLTKRYELGRLLGGVARHLLLMTATPHAGRRRTSRRSWPCWMPTGSRGGFATACTRRTPTG